MERGVRKMYARRDLRSDYGILRSYSFGERVVKHLITDEKYKKLSAKEKKKWIKYQEII